MDEDRARSSSDDIAGWLAGLGLQEYEETFRANAVDLEVLPELAEHDLEKLGVLLGHRKRMLRAIAELTPPGGAAPVSLAPPAEGDRFALPPEGAQRRQLTVMFCDLVGSTPLSLRLDPEDLRDVITAYHQRVAAIVEEADGYVARYMGDGVLVYFGYPRAHEDSAERALRAALAIADAVPRLDTAGERLDVRIGIATGLVVVGDLVGIGAGGEHQVVGDTPNLAARLQSLAAPNTALIDAATRQLVGEMFECRELGAVEVRGFGQPVPLWQVVRPHASASRFDGLRAAASTSLIGRDDEVEALGRLWERVKIGEGRVVLICGEPGIGKSRMTAALTEKIAAGPYTRLRFFCSPHHSDSSLHPFINQVQRAAAFDADDSAEAKLDKLEAALQVSDPGSPETAGLFAELLDLPSARYPPVTADPRLRRQLTLAAFARQLEGLTRERPLLAVFEDAQWSDATSLELLDMVIERVARLPVMLLITFRPEFEPPWAGLAHVTMLLLNRLSSQQTARLAMGVAGNRTLPAEIVDSIIERTDGIPLFVEELTKTLLEGGLLREEAGAYVLDGPLPPLAIPTSLQGSLLARLDRLNATKRLAQIAAALGRAFSYDLLAAVANWSEPMLNDALDQLAETELVFRRGTPPRANFTFKHALIRDAAYSTLLRRERQQLHARIAQVLTEQFRDTSEAQPEILAHHFTEAGLAEPAITHWREAGERSLRRWAQVEAVKHLTRGIDLIPLLPAGSERNRLELGLHAALGPAMRAIKGHAAPETQQAFARAQALLDERVTLAEQLSVLHGRYAAYFVLAQHAAGREVAEQSLDLAARQPQPEAAALAHRLMGEMSWATGRFVEARDHLEQCLAVSLSAQGAGRSDRAFVEDHGVVAYGFLSCTLWILGYPQQGTEAGRRSVAMARELGQPSALAFALFAELAARGLFEFDHEAAGPLAAEIIAHCQQHSLPLYPGWSRFYQGVALARQKDPRAGIAIMHEVREAMHRNKIALYESNHRYHLASAYARCGDHAAALGLLDDGIRAIEATGERVNEPELYRLRGELLLETGRIDEGESELTAALTIARGLQARMWELRAATRLARHWHDTGRTAAGRDLLLPLYGWFTEGLDSDDLVQAKSLLDRLC
jgi:class 3 adenylate cyclase/tetratricopeptide (TPR) repeat protein